MALNSDRHLNRSEVLRISGQASKHYPSSTSWGYYVYVRTGAIFSSHRPSRKLNPQAILFLSVRQIPKKFLVRASKIMRHRSLSISSQCHCMFYMAVFEALVTDLINESANQLPLVAAPLISTTVWFRKTHLGFIRTLQFAVLRYAPLGASGLLCLSWTVHASALVEIGIFQ